MKYHLKESGEPAPCRASVRSCPLGAEVDHYSTPEEARRAYEEAHASSLPHWSGLPEHQYRALNSYQGGFYVPINEGLRSHRDDWEGRELEIIRDLDELFQDHHEEPVQFVSRVLWTGGDYLGHDLKAGEIFEEEGYLSTTESETFVGDCIERGLNDGAINTVMDIEVDPDVACIRPNFRTHNHDNEEEVLFPRGCGFQVLEDSPASDARGGIRTIRVRMLPYLPPDPV